MRNRISAALIKSALAIAGAALAPPGASPVFAQVILEPDPTSTATGTVGLTNSAGVPAETLSGGSISSYGGTFSYSANFGPDGKFTVKVPAATTFRLYATISGFQNAPGATLTHDYQNIAAIPKDGAASIDMTRTGGRILARVNVTGGTLQYVSIQSWSSDSAIPAYFYGNVTSSSQTTSAELIQPMPARPSTQVYGSVSIRLPAGCTKTLSLPSKTVDVVAGTTSAVTWEGLTLDVTGQACPTGDLTGRINLSGLASAGVTKSYDYVSAYGPDWRGVSTTTGTYSMPGLATGSYSTQMSTAFAAPYSSTQFPWKSNAFTIQEGQTTVYDHGYSVGTAGVVVNATGSWRTADANWGSYVEMRHSTSGGYAWDRIDPSTGASNFVVEAGTSDLSLFYHLFFDQSSTAQRYFYEYLYHYPQAAARPRATVSEGGNVDLGTYEHKTSSSAVTFQAAQAQGQAPALLRDIQLSGTANLVDPVSGVLLERSNIWGYGYGTETSAISVNLRGVPGTYQMQATANDSVGTRYRKTFELIMGRPENTEVGSGVTQELSSTAGGTVVGLTFGTVTQAGTTTISESTAGPNAPANFAIFQSAGVNGNTGQFFYDITTTAVFSGQVQVCLTYDPTRLKTPEATLELGHYSDTTQTWEIITEEGYPDTANNRICGLTNSFSLFAGLEPLDRDVDGVLDAEDNCPVTVNPDQDDLDGDSIGNACDLDGDGDGIVNDEDRCPSLASSDNGDLDGDGIGDPCDADRDGDLVTNSNDNCPAVTNADQGDFDGDGSGDQCDADDDSDGIADAVDACAGTASGASINASGCSSPQLFEYVCSTSGAYRNHGEYVSCVAAEAIRQVSVGMMTEDQKGAVIAAAAQSNIGKK